VPERGLDAPADQRVTTVEELGVVLGQKRRRARDVTAVGYPRPLTD
jgi:hypothetical protein